MHQIYVSKRNDRIGMRLYAVIRTIYYCQQNNFKYNHVSLAYNRNNYKIYNDLFNFKKKYNVIKYTKSLKRGGKVKNMGPIFHLLNKPYDNFKTPNFIKFRKSLINLYINSNLYKNVYNNKYINICIHYRRGDTTSYKNEKFKSIKNKRLRLRYTPKNYLNQVINKLNEYMKDLPLNIHIHSDSNLNIDKLLTCKHNFNIITHFNDTAYDSLNGMIQCDILFRYGISSFSGVAAFYNKNIVISKINKEFQDLYNYKNVYKFTKCNIILRNFANKYKTKMNIEKSL